MIAGHLIARPCRTHLVGFADSQGRCCLCQRARSKRRYDQRKQDQRCVRCEAGLQDDDGVMCVECTELDRDTVKRYRRNGGQEHIRRYQARKREEHAAQGKCIRCSNPAAPGHTKCNDHLEYDRLWRKTEGGGHVIRLDRRRIRKAVRLTRDRAADHDMHTTRGRLLRAMRFLDWAPTKEIFALIGVTMTEDDHCEWDAFMTHISRGVKTGIIERYGNPGGYHYRLTPAGRAEVDRLIKETIREAA